MVMQPINPQQSAQTTTTTSSTPPPEFNGEAWLDGVIAKAEQYRGGISISKATGDVEFDDFAGIQRYARMLYAAGMVPQQKEDSEQKAIARATASIILGKRVGLTPEQSISSIYVVNNRATLYGDAPLSICRQHKFWDESGYAEWFEVDGQRIVGNPSPAEFNKETTRCVVTSLRKGASGVMVSTFSMADAIQAGLLGRNAALYTGYAFRMLKFRARGYNLGLGIKELADDDQIDNETKPIPTGTVDLRKPKPQAETTAVAVPPTVPEESKPVEPAQSKPVEPSQTKHRSTQLDELFGQLEARGLSAAFYAANPDVNGEDIVNSTKAKQAAFMGKITAFLRDNPA